jgi:hypothetical protein
MMYLLHNALRVEGDGALPLQDGSKARIDSNMKTQVVSGLKRQARQSQI